MTLYSSMELPAQLHATLARMKFETATPIQAQAIPLALKGRDILGTAQTGTGKTAAFTVPIVARLLEEPQSAALIMTPTRELASQVMAVVNDMVGFRSAIKTALLIGGEAMGKQFMQLKARPRIIVGTPGRINDHLERGSVKLKDTNIIVLDEADRMLDMGFGIQIDAILEHVPEQRQTLLFSATLPKQILNMAQRYQNDPERISVGEVNAAATRVEQSTVYLSSSEKYGELTKQLGEREGTIIVFVKTKFGAERLAKRLIDDNHSAQAIHGDLQQRKRDRVIREFREKRHRILVATDVAARGLDIPHIEHVVNFDLPQSPEDYIHRIGRTARANAKGSAVSFVSADENRKWKAIAYLLNPETAGRAPRDVKAQPRSGRPSVKPTSAKANPFGKPFAKKPYEKKPFGKKDEGERAFGDKPFRKEGEFKPRRESGERPQREERQWDDKPFAKKPFGEKKFGDKKAFGDKPFRKDGEFKPRHASDDRPKRDDARDAKPYSKKAFGEKSFGEKSFGEKKPYEKKPQGERSYGERSPQGERSFEKKSFPKKAFGDKPFEKRGDKPFEKRGEESRSARPAPRAYPGDKKAFSGKPFAGKKFGQRRPA